MLAEDQNNGFGQKLRDLDQIPDGFEFSSDAVWNKLEAKLTQQKKPAPIWVVRKFLAAASLVLVLSLITVLLLRRQSKPDQTNLVSKQIPFIISNKPSTETVNIVPKTSKKSIENSKPIHKKESDQPIDSSALIKNELAVAEPAPTISSALFSINSVAASSLVVEKKQPIAVKRLAVIHINELGKTAEPIYSKSTNKNVYLNEVEEAPLISEHPKPWWQPKPKPVNPIISLTDNQ